MGFFNVFIIGFLACADAHGEQYGTPGGATIAITFFFIARGGTADQGGGGKMFYFVLLPIDWFVKTLEGTGVEAGTNCE